MSGWWENLDKDDQGEMIEELRMTLDAENHSGAATLDPGATLEKLAQVMTAWKHSVEAWADPEVRKALTTPSDGTDYGPVPPPSVDG